MSCCHTPRPDCMGMLLPGIGDRCQALQAELARFPRPGPQLPTRRCEHAASGCNYPEGDCAGLCLAMPAVPRSGWEVEQEVEGMRIRLAGGDQALCESRNRASFFIASKAFQRNLQEYFDTPEALEQVAEAFKLAAVRMRRFGT